MPPLPRNGGPRQTGKKRIVAIASTLQVLRLQKHQTDIRSRPIHQMERSQKQVAWPGDFREYLLQERKAVTAIPEVPRLFLLCRPAPELTRRHLPPKPRFRWLEMKLL